MIENSPTDSVVVDCDRCLVRSPSACGDCIVTVLLGAPPAGIEIDADEMAALGVLADAGPDAAAPPCDAGHRPRDTGWLRVELTSTSPYSGSLCDR